MRSIVRWRFPTGVVREGPAVPAGVVYVSSNISTLSSHLIGWFESGFIYALIVASGELIWRYQTVGTTTAPTVVEGIVYGGSFPDFLYALDAGTGERLWRFVTENDVPSTLGIVVDGVVYVGTGAGYLYALQPPDLD